jgi:hypothetical protein
MAMKPMEVFSLLVQIDVIGLVAYLIPILVGVVVWNKRGAIKGQEAYYKTCIVMWLLLLLFGLTLQMMFVGAKWLHE